jgi:hypothetical protein
MTIRQVIGHMRAYWLVAGIPLGLLATAYGNSLYATPHQSLGMVFFFGGFVLAGCGMPTLKRFLEEDPLRKGIENVAWLGMILLFFIAGPIRVVAKALWGVAQPGDYRAAVLPLILIWLLLPLAVRRVEPKDFPLRRLPSRIQRAAVFRTIANGAGIGAVAAFLNARFVVAHPAPLISTVLTLMVAMAVVTHKTYARARKLCTQTRIDLQTLLRDMDELDDAKSRDRTRKKPSGSWWPRPRTGQGTDDEQIDKRMTARRSWDVLKLDLCTTIDSGYRLFGMPFLADSAIADLERQVLAAIDATDPGVTGPARDDLCVILEACSARIDVLA